MYLTNDLEFPKETLAMIKVVGTPLNIMFAFVSGYLSSSKPFLMQSLCLLSLIGISFYLNNYLLYYFPDKENITETTVLHVSIVFFLQDMIQSFEFVTAFAILLKLTDKRISGIHVTVLAAVYNLCEFPHKFYIFKLVDLYGLYTPNIALTVVGVLVWLLYWNKFMGLEKKSIKSWHVTDSVLTRSTKPVKS